MGYYSSNKSIEKALPLIKANDAFKTISELYDLLNENGWCEFSAYSKKFWNPDKKCDGQCNATVLLVQEFFGGKIYKYPNPDPNKKMHYFNRINGCDVDLTSEQFSSPLTGYGNQNTSTRRISKWDYEKSAYILKLRLGLG